jgi:hypothetical protein
MLLTHQRAGIGRSQAAQAAPMIERGSAFAAAELYAAAGGRAGMATANARLGLDQTVTGRGQPWYLTQTTVSDQLRLLTDLTANISPLSKESRDYELRLMADVQPGERWGVSAVASALAGYAIKDGWMTGPQFWVSNSIGIVRAGRHELLIAVLADGQSTKAAGAALDAEAAQAAARVITNPSPKRTGAQLQCVLRVPPDVGCGDHGVRQPVGETQRTRRLPVGTLRLASSAGSAGPNRAVSRLPHHRRDRMGQVLAELASCHAVRARRIHDGDGDSQGRGAQGLDLGQQGRARRARVDQAGDRVRGRREHAVGDRGCSRSNST